MPRVAFARRCTMAASDEDLPKKKPTHEIGQDLALLSIKELDERVALLKEEIARLEASKAGKQASRSAADQLFKRRWGRGRATGSSGAERGRERPAPHRLRGRRVR